MNRNHCLHRRILILLASIVLVTGCNLDSDGIFMRISESEETVEVGAITLIATKDDAFYALTTEKGLQKYDPGTKQWTKIPSDSVMHVATDGSSLFYATRAGEDEENSVFAYNLTTSGITPKDDQYVIAMSPTNDLMLVKDAVDADIYFLRADSFGITKRVAQKDQVPGGHIGGGNLTALFLALRQRSIVVQKGAAADIAHRGFYDHMFFHFIKFGYSLGRPQLPAVALPVIKADGK